MTGHLGDDHLDSLRSTRKLLEDDRANARAAGISDQAIINLEQAAIEIERYRKLGTWDLPQNDGWWLDREGEAHYINVSGLTGERSEWFYRQLGPWREIKDCTQIVDDVFETNVAAKRNGREEIITEVRALLDTLEGLAP